MLMMVIQQTVKTKQNDSRVQEDRFRFEESESFVLSTQRVCFFSNGINIQFEFRQDIQSDDTLHTAVIMMVMMMLLVKSVLAVSFCLLTQLHVVRGSGGHGDVNCDIHSSYCTK